MRRINTTQWKLRRLAARVVRVHGRQREKDAGLAAFDSLPETASLYITHVAHRKLVGINIRQTYLLLGLA